MSLEEFERLPDNGMRHELNKGELVRMPPAKLGHIRMAKKIARVLEQYAEPARLGEVFIEAGFRLSAIHPPTFRQPDVSLVSSDRVRTTGDDQHFEGAPELVVEIVSPGNTAADLEEKVDQYLAAGARAVWVVYPRLRRVHVHRADGTITAHGVNQQLTAEDILPGVSIPVASLFD